MLNLINLRICSGIHPRIMWSLRNYCHSVSYKLDRMAMINISVKKYKEIKIIPETNAGDELKIKFYNHLNESIDPKKVNGLEMYFFNKMVSILDRSSKNSDLSCVLEVPIQSLINVDTNSNVELVNLQSDDISVKTGGAAEIFLNGIKAGNVNLSSESGKISTKGLVLGVNVSIKTHSGEIKLDKIQGENLNVQSDSGNISTSSTYSNNSHFSTQSGHLNLNNVHRNCEVLSGPLSESLIMRGFSGTLNGVVNSKHINLQLSVLKEVSKFHSKNSQSFKVGLSEEILENTYLNVNSNCPIATTDLPEIFNGKNFQCGTKEMLNSLEINNESGENLNISKTSWIDSLELKGLRN